MFLRLGGPLEDYRIPARQHLACLSIVLCTHPLRATSAIRHLSRIDDACDPIRQWALIPRRAPRAACNNMTGATCGVWPRRAPRDGRPAAQKQTSMCAVYAFGLSGASWNPLEGFEQTLRASWVPLRFSRELQSLELSGRVLGSSWKRCGSL